MELESEMVVRNQPYDKKINKLNITCLRRFKSILNILHTSNVSDSSMLFILLLVLCVGQQLIIYNIGLLPSKFFTVLGGRKQHDFKPLLLQAFALIIIIALLNSAVKLASGYLYVYWRKALTNYLHAIYLGRPAILYHVNFVQNDVDNIDQRIAQDVDRFCAQLRDISPKLIISPITIVYYSVQCFKASGYTGPMVIYTYFVLGTIVNKLIMSSIVSLVFRQEKYEGDFRYWHTVIRSYAESISFLKGENAELKNVRRVFRNLLRIQLKIINSELFLNFATNLFDYVGSILSYIVISVPIFAGKYNSLSPVALSSVISKNAFVSMYLINCFSTLIDLSTKMTDIFGYTHRIGELIECFIFCKDNLRNDSKNINHSIAETDDMVLFQQITYSSPKSYIQFFTNLSMSVTQGKNLLIIGHSGLGKSSLLRILLGIWKPNSGNVQINIPINRILFLPQKAFLTSGSLTDQVIYPTAIKENIDTVKITHILEEVGLQTVVQRAGGIDVEPDWNWAELSPGEVQRLSFARVCYHKPLLAILDEPTSALGVEDEHQFYSSCKERGITVVTAGHRDSLRQYHDVCLEVIGGGEWKYYKL